MGTCCSTNNNKKPQKTTIEASNKKDIALPVKSNANNQATQVNQPAITKPVINQIQNGNEHQNEIQSLPKEIKIKFMYEGKQIDMNPISCPEIDVFENYIYPVVNNLPVLSEYSYKTNDYKSIDINKNIIDIFKNGDEDYHNKVHTVNVVYHGLDIPINYKDIVSQYSSKTNLIGCPIPNSNPFEFRIFCSDNMTLTKASINIDEFPDLSYFGDFSAYCNGNNYLYLSGGEETKDPTDNTMENKYLNWVCKISLIDGKLTKLDGFNDARFWHSMIHVPNRYVFIVGGNNTKSVELLNTETGEITKDSELNDYHSEPTLCLVNSNYLYCFLGFKYDIENNYSNTIERCNLRMGKRTWEVVTLSRGNETDLHCTIETRFFTIGYFNENNLLILGGDNIKNKDIDSIIKPTSYLYDYRTDSVREYHFDEGALDEFNGDLFGEKFFIPMKNSTNNMVSCIIPKQTSDKLRVYLMTDGNQLEIKEFEDEENISQEEDRI